MGCGERSEFGCVGWDACVDCGLAHCFKRVVPGIAVGQRVALVVRAARQQIRQIALGGGSADQLGLLRCFALCDVPTADRVA